MANQSDLFNADSGEKTLFENEYYENTSFEKVHIQDIRLSEIEFFNCTFTNNILFKGVFKKCRFEKCTFKDCDLSLSKFTDSVFVDVNFTNCKMVGIDWTVISKPLKISFTGCIISDSSFYNLDLIGLVMAKCIAHNTDFEKTDLSKSDCSKTDFMGSKFSGTNLSGADLREALNYFINPNNNKIKKAKFSYPEVITLLDVWDIIIE